ncbi:hypothetical protein DFJ63DRAFT_342742 [Scheffersomyces coipomensis]|uniref:uncharacterized protein n=1 Tax=Scheffersomyces coipomensis TaxID=1788519 RepID=UPI00315CB553
MAKPVRVKTTESSKRHAFSSFRERVDSIKIEPNLSLSKRAFDYAETSHFLSTLQHWKEINLSGNFTDFLDKVEINSQSLPQILHHQDSIFDALYSSIEKNDVHSIQPLLELLSQFIHDLGPDFMPYYIRFLNLLTTIALNTDPNDSQNDRNTSNVLEWSFNCLTFAFKYLSRSLIDDLKPTFETLLPILKVEQKTYISRFCAEALSFLIRKSKIDALNNIIQFSFNDQSSTILENDSYCESLITLYSESMKNTQGTFHSKSTIILSNLIENALSNPDSSIQSKYISIVSDILLDIINHGSEDSCERFYSLTSQYLKSILEETTMIDSVISVSQLINVLCFAESGKKINSWQPIVEVVNSLMNKITITLGFEEESNYNDLMESMIYLFSIFFRNASIQTLTKNHKSIFDFMISINNGHYFLSFSQSCLSVNQEKLLNFGIVNTIQDYVHNIPQNEVELRQLSLFLATLNKTNNEIASKIDIPNTLKVSLIEQVSQYPNDLEKLYWRLLILRHNGNKLESLNPQVLVNLIKSLLSSDSDNMFNHDIIATSCDSLTEVLDINSTETQVDIYNHLIEKFDILKESSIFVIAFNRFLIKFKQSVSSILTKQVDSLLHKIAENLFLPSNVSRIAAIDLIQTFYDVAGMTAPFYLPQIKLIEQIPLSINTSRDLTLRIKNLSKEFKAHSKPSELECTYITNYFFGLLSNRFQPSWQAVYDCLPELATTCSELIWNLAYRFITFDYNDQSYTYNPVDETEFEHTSSLIDWQPNNSRLKNNFTSFDGIFLSKYRNIYNSILEFAENSRETHVYSKLVRSQVIQALTHVVYIAEKNSSKLIPLALNQFDEDDEENSASATWSLKDRNELIGLFAKFKKLKKVNDADLLYDHLLKLLSNKNLSVQKLALDAILNWGIPAVNRYRDNLRNLLDDTIFRDELSNFINPGSDSKIEEANLAELMPLVLRVLFGRVQGATKSNSKVGRKFAVISVLPNFSDDYIIQFIKLGSEKIAYMDYFMDGTLPELNAPTLKKINGFVNLLSEIYSTLGSKFSSALLSTVEPLVFSLVVAQKRIDSETNSSSQVSVNEDKAARSVRQMGMRCLNDLFKLVGDAYSWEDQISLIYENLMKPRLPNFSSENLQQVSSLMRIMLNWVESENTVEFLFIDDFAPARAIISLLGSTKAKESVVSAVLEFTIKALSKKVTHDQYFTFLALLVDSLLKNLPAMIESIHNREINSKAVNVLLLLIDGGFIDDDSTRSSLIESLTKALEKPVSSMDSSDKSSILITLSSLIQDYDCTFADIEPLYNSCSKLFRVHPEKRIRETLVDVFRSIGDKFEDYKEIASLLEGLNSYSQKRMQELDFEKRLQSFNLLNEELYLSLTPSQWMPLLCCALFFINDTTELVIRTNGAYTLRRYIDCYSAITDESTVAEYVSLLKNLILPHLKIGLRKDKEEIQSEYVSVLEHIVVESKHFVELQDMRVLTFHNDDESNFFKNINHIQVHRRQRAVKRLSEYGNQLTANSISHYILPIIERYAFTDEERLKNIASETVETINHLIKCISWNHFKALFRRYLSNLRSGKETQIKIHVNLIVSISKGFMESKQSQGEDSTERNISNLPSDQSEIDDFILKEMFPPLLKILVIRKDDTIVARAPLAEALSCLLVCISENLIESELPGVLTSTCQVMRSRSEELRDAIRKTLGNILNLLGPKYFRFILKELKAALSRGSQIHVLSYTIHYLLVSISASLKHGDLDDCIEMLVEIIMEDIFGAAGQEKDAEGYTSKMKEVKFKKSFDSGEIVSSNVNLASFSLLINPIKLLLRETISFKTQNKLDELLRRFALGLNHNEEAGSRDILVLCYEIHKQGTPQVSEPRTSKSKTQEHFLVNLNSKVNKSHVNNLQLTQTLQKLSFEMLSTAITRHDSLLSPHLLEGFVPLLDDCLKSESEGVVMSSLKALNIIIRLEFSDQENAIFKSAVRRSLQIIKDSPSTNSEICQSSLKFLATALRNKADIGLKDSAFAYVLSRVLPDLEEPNKQGLAFNFLRAVVAQHVMLPEVYDTMDKVSKIMVVNHSKEIRDISRRIYYQFLMEYDQGRGKLEKQFKFLVNNLAYPTEAGRQSVMELVHLVISKAGLELLEKISSSFFVALANVIVSDDSPKCREMASALIGTILSKLGRDNLSNVEKYCIAWLNQSNNTLLKRCGFIIYKLYVNEVGFSEDGSFDKIALENARKIIDMSSSENDEQVEWELLYSSLSLFSSVCSKLKNKVLQDEYESTWKSIINVLLFPHAWVRLISSRLIGILLSSLDKVSFEFSNYTLQTIAYRLLRQLSAPGITEELGTQVVKNLVLISMYWQSNNIKYEENETNEPTESTGEKYEHANEFLISRVCSVLRQERTAFIAKKSGIKLVAMLIQIFNEQRLIESSEAILLALYNFTEMDPSDSRQDEEIVNLTLECMQLIEQKLGVSTYTKVYAQVKSKVNLRRQERKTKRAQMAVNAPDISAKRKLRKHERFREKRKHEKDENGYYRSKKKRAI